MEKYLLQILESNNRVIVPEFGAFIIKQKNPLTIIFNEFLQYNDGMLVDAISKNEGIDRDSAKKKIDEFIVKLNSELESVGQYVLQGIGVVTKGTTGKISLEKEEPKKSGKKESKPVESSEKKPPQTKETKKAPPKKTSDIKEETIEIVKEKPLKEKPKEEEKPKIVNVTPKPEEKVAEAEKSKIVKETPKPEEKITEAEKQKVTAEPEIKPKKVEEEKKVEKQIYETKSAFTSTSKSEGNKRSKTRLIIWLILIVIVNGILIGYFFYTEELSALFHKQPKEFIEVETQPEDQLQPEIEPSEEIYEDMTTQEIEEEPVQKVENFRTPVQSGTRYYIVAGVFGDENNADNLVIELRKKGYNAEKFGKIGSLHAVSYNVFQTKADADVELRRIQSGVDPEAWIKEVK